MSRPLACLHANRNQWHNQLSIKTGNGGKYLVWVTNAPTRTNKAQLFLFFQPFSSFLTVLCLLHSFPVIYFLLSSFSSFFFLSCYWQRVACGHIDSSFRDSGVSPIWSQRFSADFYICRVCHRHGKKKQGEGQQPGHKLRLDRDAAACHMTS